MLRSRPDANMMRGDLEEDGKDEGDDVAGSGSE